jgi:NAD(P)-dependent dehydrogenase (short-subunit alcohol dehydrogenase family)
MTTPIQKVALVTGAARGIGLATAKRFLADGWRVALLDIERALLDEAVAALADPEHTLAIHCDVSDAGAVAAAMAAVNSRFGRLDALVNNAGIAVFAPLLETEDQDWNRVLAVNLTGPFLCTKAAATSPGRSLRSMAVLMRPASACRPCAASAETDRHDLKAGAFPRRQPRSTGAEIARR